MSMPIKAIIPIFLGFFIVPAQANRLRRIGRCRASCIGDGSWGIVSLTSGSRLQAFIDHAERADGLPRRGRDLSHPG
jgi:hypothetical protein